MEKNKENNHYTLLAYMARFLIIIGLILLLPLLTIPFYPEEIIYFSSFLLPSVFAILIGSFLTWIIPFNPCIRLSLGEDAIIVTSAWLLATLFSAIPFILSHQLNFTQAYFESVSGWTTTGLSVINVEETAHIFLIHRSITQFFGGVGIVLILLSALSGTFGLRLYHSEGHSDYLLPNLIKSSRLILTIYLGYIIAGTFLYTVAGMPLFDAINHSIGSLSTGGFSTKSLSIEAYHSPIIEWITIILMLLGTTNFAAHLLLLKGKFSRFFALSEIKFMFILIGLSTPIMVFSLLTPVYNTLTESFRNSIFQIVSAISTTGYATVNFNDWTPFALLLMVILMIIGGGAGSTSGGIKLYRILLLSKQCIWNLKMKFKSDVYIKEDSLIKPEGKIFLDSSSIIEASNYAFAYLTLLLIGTFIFLAHGYSLQSALFEFSSALGTVGLSIGITSATTPSLILWTEIVGMMFGRLEIWVIFIAIIKIFKPK